MDSVPPALARLQQMNQDVIAGRNTLTPILNRDDAMREWERRQAGKVTAAQPYPQLEYLQQQAEMAATTGMSNWTTSHTRYPAAPSKLSLTYQPQTVLADEDNNNTRRDAVMSNVRAAARNDTAGGVYSTSNIISSPPQAYTGNTATTGNRYPTANYNNQGQPQAASTFDSIDRRTDVGNMYVPIQSDQYQGYPVGPPLSSVRHVAPPAQAGPNFQVIPGQNSTQQRNPFQIVDGQQTGSKDTRRGNGDIWPRWKFALVVFSFFFPFDGLPLPTIHFHTCKISVSLPPVYLAFSPICAMDRFQETWYSLLIFLFYISVDQWWMDVHLRFIVCWTSPQLPRRLPNNECYISKPWLLIYFQCIFGVHDITCKTPYLGWSRFFFFPFIFSLFFKEIYDAYLLNRKTGQKSLVPSPTYMIRSYSTACLFKKASSSSPVTKSF